MRAQLVLGGIAAIGAALVCWFYFRRRASTMDRFRDAMSEASDRIADVTGTTRSAFEHTAERVRDAATS